MFQEQLIVLNIQASNSMEVIRLLGHRMLGAGLVKDTFIDSVIEREKVFSTGLPLGVLNIALPHTDSIHVNQEAIAIGILHTPVEFNVMGNPAEIVQVNIVFLMAIKDQGNQVKYLQRFAELIQDPLIPERIYCAQSAKEIIELLRPHF